MEALNFETGIITLPVNGVCEVTFNPTDGFFVEKLFNAFNTLDMRQDAYKAEVDKIADKRQIFEIGRQRDAEMRGIVDGVFSQPVSDKIFAYPNGEPMSTYSRADGLPIWCNFLLAIMDKVDTTFAREQKATNPRIAKYTSKYHR